MKIKKMILIAEPGDSIDHLAHDAVTLSRDYAKCGIEFEFNGVNVVYDGTTEEDRLKEQYRVKLNTPKCMPKGGK